jgi:hypothetical protein
MTIVIGNQPRLLWVLLVQDFLAAIIREVA